MLGLAAICWAIWKARNKTCFENIQIKNPHDIIFSACLFMRYWSGLYPDGDQDLIKEGVETVMQTSIELLKKTHEAQVARITDGGREMDVGRDAELEEDRQDPGENEA